MIEKITFNLIQQYINGWKKNDLPMIISCLTEDCVVIESHGPTYHGVSDIKQWFKFWLEATSKITKWDIHSFYFCENKKLLLLNGISLAFQMMLNTSSQASVWSNSLRKKSLSFMNIG